ncbi:MAG: hypothetical protein EBS21_08405 [Sphingomonadaceae bacterium]|jgi:hypothetical protein|nr:hypothetical protein [Sphingomonadaceae bacterium]
MSDKVHAQLCAALMRMAGPAQIIRSQDRPWASVTFSGARHWITLNVPSDRVAALKADLPEAEFNLPGQLVADLTITTTRDLGLETQLDIEALTVVYADMGASFALAPPDFAAQRQS